MSVEIPLDVAMETALVERDFSCGIGSVHSAVVAPVGVRQPGQGMHLPNHYSFVTDFRYTDATFTFTYSKGSKR